MYCVDLLHRSAVETHATFQQPADNRVDGWVGEWGICTHTAKHRCLRQGAFAK